MATPDHIFQRILNVNVLYLNFPYSIKYYRFIVYTFIKNGAWLWTDLSLESVYYF